MSYEIFRLPLRVQKIQVTFYISLIVANLLFGVLHPDNKLIAAGGVVFFTVALLRQFYVERPFKTR